MIVARLHVGVNMVLRSEQRLSLFHGNIYFQPITTLGQYDSSIFDATLSEPRLDGGESLDRRCECVRDLVLLAAIIRHYPPIEMF